jgi:hypothetical protein
MEGIPLGRDRVLKVEREYEGCRIEGHLLATAYEEVVPRIRRGLSVPGQSGEAREGHCERASVGA